jgi:hypothetical protein
MLAAGDRAAGLVLKNQVQVERNPSIYKIRLLAQPVCSFGVDLAALSSNPLQRLIKTTPFLSLLFRSHANWAAAHQNFSSCRTRATACIRRLRSGPVSACAVFILPLFSEIPANMQILFNLYLSNHNSK